MQTDRINAKEILEHSIVIGPSVEMYYELEKHLPPCFCKAILLNRDIKNSTLSFLKRSKLTPVYFRNQLCSIAPNQSRLDPAEYYNITTQVLASPVPYFLAERISKRSQFIGSLIQRVVANSLSLLTELKPSYLLCLSNPHAFETWIFAKVSELAGIKCLIAEQTLNTVPFISLFKGLESHEELDFVPNGSITNIDKLSQYSYQYCLRLLDSGRPFVGIDNQIKTINRTTNAHYGLLALTLRQIYCNIVPVAKNPLILKTYADHWLGIQKRAVDIESFEDNYFLYILHYRPEKTHMPDGLILSDQILQIRLISQALPDNYRLIVREHPSFMSLLIEQKWYGKYFTDEISSLTNVVFSRHDSNLYLSIKKSLGVITTTSTVGLQSLLCGKSVLLFGLANYKSHEKATLVRCREDIQQFIDKLVLPHDEIDLYNQNELAKSSYNFVFSRLNAAMCVDDSALMLNNFSIPRHLAFAQFVKLMHSGSYYLG